MATSPARPPASATHRAAQTLRAEILAHEQGAFLGTEDELVARLGVSRPTLRQAARMLEHEQLILVKRGVAGGYFVRKPDVGAVTRAAAFYLQARRTSMRDLLLASAELVEAVMVRAALSPQAQARARLRGAVAAFSRSGGQRPDTELLAREVEFIEAVLELAANPPLELFTRVLYEVGLAERSTRVFRDRSDRVAAWAAARTRLGEAILAGDAELTSLLVRRDARQMLEWIANDLGEAPDAGLATLAREPLGGASGGGDSPAP
jgi:DNA-binding FadR family transcriptional regulator